MSDALMQTRLASGGGRLAEGRGPCEPAAAATPSPLPADPRPPDPKRYGIRLPPATHLETAPSAAAARGRVQLRGWRRQRNGGRVPRAKAGRGRGGGCVPASGTKLPGAHAVAEGHRRAAGSGVRAAEQSLGLGRRNTARLGLGSEGARPSAEPGTARGRQLGRAAGSRARGGEASSLLAGVRSSWYVCVTCVDGVWGGTDVGPCFGAKCTCVAVATCGEGVCVWRARRRKEGFGAALGPKLLGR